MDIMAVLVIIQPFSFVKGKKILKKSKQIDQDLKKNLNQSVKG
jgi:hypothetical protein